MKLQHVLFMAAISAIAASAQAAVLVDFGKTGYNGTPYRLSTDNASFDTGYNPTGSVTTTFTADTATFTFGQITSAWQAPGMTITLWNNGYLDRISPFTGIAGTDKLAINARIASASPDMTFYHFDLTFKNAAGASSTYRFMNVDYPWTSSGQFTNTLGLVTALSDIAHPVATTGTGFNFATDKLNQIIVQFQNAQPAPTSAGSVAFELDNIQTVSVPEPAALGLVASGAMLFLRRRRK